MKTNKKVSVAPVLTHEGGTAVRINKERQLRRTLMSCLLWEDSFYESGKSVSERLAELVKTNKPATVAAMAIEARNDFKLRHAPLFIAREMARHDTHKPFVANVLVNIIQRADELAEFLALYWKDGKTPIANQVKKGLAMAFTKFNEYELAKWNKDGAVKLRDVLFMIHARPISEEQADLWKRLVDGTLQTPDTWEVELSAGKGENKKESWTRLLNEKKLGGLAFLRNLRNMTEAGVEKSLIKSYFKVANFSKVLPFRFIAAARYAPSLESDLEAAMIQAATKEEKIGGRTVLLIDVSGSMDGKLSAKSENSRLETACALAILAREVFDDVEVYTFSNSLAVVPNRRGFALRDAIVKSQGHGGTNLGHSLNQLHATTKYDRLITFTDEQSHDKVGAPKGKGYMINVATYQNGVGYGAWTHIDGFSEAVIDYIREFEKEDFSDLKD